MILYNLDLLFAVWSSPLLSVVKKLITTWHTDKKEVAGCKLHKRRVRQVFKKTSNLLVSQTYLKEETI